MKAYWAQQKRDQTEYFKDRGSVPDGFGQDVCADFPSLSLLRTSPTT